jgi:hypothetical protein
MQCNVVDDVDMLHVHKIHLSRYQLYSYRKMKGAVEAMTSECQD